MDIDAIFLAPCFADFLAFSFGAGALLMALALCGSWAQLGTEPASYKLPIPGISCQIIPGLSRSSNLPDHFTVSDLAIELLRNCVEQCNLRAAQPNAFELQR